MDLNKTIAFTNNIPTNALTEPTRIAQPISRSRPQKSEHPQPSHSGTPRKVLLEDCFGFPCAAAFSIFPGFHLHSYWHCLHHDPGLIWGCFQSHGGGGRLVKKGKEQ